MVLLQSKNYDLSTNTVIEWLLHNRVPFVRLNGEDTAEIAEFTISSNGLDITFVINGSKIHLSQINSYWHRRGRFRLGYSKQLQKQLRAEFKNKKNADGIYANYKEQFASLEEYVNEKLASLPVKIGNAGKSIINKLAALDFATEVGLQIPETIITGSKARLQEFIAASKSVITKSILDSVFLWDPNEHLVHYTELLSEEMLSRLPDSFALSLFQKTIPKKYELRTFFLKGNFYSMCIFSQADAQTCVDFRKYNDSKPNRTIPFALPTQIEQKLTDLMELLKLDSGSIDMIVSQEDEYIFLEVNPVGQFGMVSYPCNYYIEREIAAYLSLNSIQQ